MKKSRYSQWEAFRVSPEIKQMLVEIADAMSRDKSETFRVLVEKAHREMMTHATQKTV